MPENEEFTGTYFATIYNRFLGKITDDMYLELTPEDTIRDLQTLLIHSLPGFEFPRKNLYNYTLIVEQIEESEVQDGDFIIGVVWADLSESDDTPPMVLIEHSYFAEQLTEEEMEIISLLMVEGWVQRQITSVENIRMKYSGPDFKMVSQANHLSKLLTLRTEARRQAFHLQRLYKRREMGEGGYKSTWSMFGPQSR